MTLNFSIYKAKASPEKTLRILKATGCENMDIKQIIGLNIKYHRQQRRYSQEELASKTGVSTSAISDIETGSSDPKATTLYKISHALNIDMAMLFDENITSKDIKWRFDLKDE